MKCFISDGVRKIVFHTLEKKIEIQNQPDQIKNKKHNNDELKIILQSLVKPSYKLYEITDNEPE